MIFRETVTCVEWVGDAGAFRFERPRGATAFACFITPDGTVTELSDAGWAALAMAVSRVVPHQGLPFRKNKSGAAAAHRNAGKPWDAGQDATLKRGWMAGESARSLSTRLGRSLGGIAARLVRLGLVDERAEARLRSDASAPGSTLGDPLQQGQ